MPPARPDVSVILVSYNTRAMTLDCLRTLKRGLVGLTAEIWLVDNASDDGTPDAVTEAFTDVRLLANTANRGFGAANNQALEVATGRYMLLLNTDAFVEPDAVGRLVRYMDEHTDVAAAGPRLFNGDGSPQASVHQLDTPWHAFAQYTGLARLTHRSDAKNQAHEPGLQLGDVYLKGACLIVRRKAYEQAGGFDERFFFYGDEADWEKRMSDRGWRLALVDQAHVKHLVGKSGGDDRLRFTLHYYAARDQYMHKHFGISGLLVYRVGVLLWCLRKLAQQAWWRVRPDRQPNPFAIAVHRFLLRGLCRSPQRLADAIASDPLIRKPASHATASAVSA
jgi:GT2 family glycosyltransferase